MNLGEKATRQQSLKPMHFPQSDIGQVMLEYIVTDYTRHNMLTRTYIVDFEPSSVQECPVRYSSMYDTPEETLPCPELAFTPVAMCKDPFRQGRHKIVLCEANYADKRDKTVAHNTRKRCREVLERVKEHEPLYAFEQEYFIVDKKGVPLEWDKLKADTDNCMEMNFSHMERSLADIHLEACLYAGLKLSGMNREMGPSEWEYQIGPLPGLEACDQVLISRYILLRLATMNDLNVTFTQPPLTRLPNVRCVMNLNVSTKKSREEGGIKELYRIVENLSRHSETVLKYYDLHNGEDMRWFLSGEEFMPSYHEFVCKVGDKDRSTIRIPTHVAAEGKGYLEERRPIADADPYDVVYAFTSAGLLESNGL